MSRANRSILTASEIKIAFSDGTWAETYPPSLSVKQAAELAQVSVGTLYDWSSRGLLARCAKRRGKRLRIWRDRFIEFLFSNDESETTHAAK